MTELTQENLRMEKLVVRLKELFLSFPVIARGELTNSLGRYTDDQIDQALDHLIVAGLLTINQGKKGGLRYVRKGVQ